MHTFICIVLWIDEWSKTNYNIGCRSYCGHNGKICSCSLVKSRGANRLLANEVVGPPRPKGVVERSGLGSSNYRRKTCDTRNRYFAYNREEFWLESRTSDVGQGIRSFWTGRALSQKSWPLCVADRLQSSRFCARKLGDTPLLFCQQRWQVVLACECVLADRKMENLVGRPAFNT